GPGHGRTESPAPTRSTAPVRVGPARPGPRAARHPHAAHPAPWPAAPAPQTVKLQPAPTGQVYVCLVERSGKILIHSKDLAASQAIPARRASTLLLTLGNRATDDAAP